MKKLFSFTMLAVGVLLLLGQAEGAKAKNTVFKVAFVDVKKVFSQYSGTKSAQKAMADAIKAKEQEVNLKDEELKKLKQEFKEKKLLMSEEVKKKKQDEIDRKTRDLEQETMSIRQSLQSKESTLVEDIVGKISAVAASVAEAKGYDLVLEKNAIYYGGDDLTADVIKALENQK